MNTIIATLTGLPLWAYITAAAVVLVAVAAIVVLAVLRAQFNRRFLALHDKSGDELDEAIEAFRNRYGDAALLRRSAHIERLLARKGDGELVAHLGLDELWIRRLRERGSEGDFRRVLTYVGGSGLWPCFLMALRHERRAARLLEWIRSREAWYAIREIASAGGGEEFDGDAARLLLRDYMDQVREFSGDPDWSVRHFAVVIMLADASHHSLRGLWEAVSDGEYRIRALIARDFAPEDLDAWYRSLYDYVLHDPVYAVRRAARDRIARDFPERYQIRLSELEPYEASHVLELLTSGSKEDQSAALEALAGDNLELRLPAALFLQREGILARMLSEAKLGDAEDFERRESLLGKAAAVHVSGFLRTGSRISEPGSLLLALHLLQEHGEVGLIDELGERVFNSRFDPEYGPKLYRAALDTMQARGDERAADLLKQELRKRRYESAIAAELIDHTTGFPAYRMHELYMELLTDPAFEAREALTSAIVASGGEMAVPELIRIGRDAEGRYPQQVRLHALRTLGALQLDYCLGFLLEHLRVFPLHEARRFASTLAEQDGSLFDSHVERLLTTTDAGVRAGVISVLPATERKSFAKQIKAALDDADAEVRVAAAWALAEFGDNTSLNAAADRLRDPVESVRRETARALGFAGTKKLLDQLRELIEDEQEVDAVRLAAIEGLAASPAPESVDILVDALDAYPHYADAINGALAEKTGRKTLGQLVERFKDAEPKLRDNLKDAFTRMGGDGEQTMLEILREEIASLAPVVSEVLEETGRVESLIRQLRHRDATARRDAAATLALIGTPQAFRGIVQAARDPEQDVRVQVSRALERLNSEDGQDILQQLQQDPDRRVRKYTQWALHRIETKSA